MKMVGTWRATVLIHTPGKESLSGEGTVTAERISLGNGIHSVMKVKLVGAGPYEEHDLWAYDSSERKMHFYSVSSTGAVRDHVGHWAGDDTLEFEWSGEHEGKMANDKILVKWSSPTEITISETLKSEDEVLQLLSFKLNKGKSGSS
jgi:hypothetical protein